MKYLPKIAVALLGLILGFKVSAQIPPFPVDPYLDSWTFYDTTHWNSDLGYAPKGFTNIVGDESAWSSDYEVLGCNGLVVDSTNEAFLNYRVVETNGHVNLSLTNGTLWFWFSPNWTSSSADDSGSGPGVWGRFIDVGAYTSDAAFGWWSLLVSPDGNNIYFSGQTNGVGTNYLNAPISWTAGSWHLVALGYSATNSILYLDGEVATNGLGVSYWPGQDALTNGFWLGSDFTGSQQIHGEFVDVEAWLDREWSADYFSYYYNYALPFLPGGFTRSTFNPPDFSSGGGSTNFPNWYGTNVLWLYIAGIESNTAGLFLINTEPDVSYEIQSKTDLSLTNWTSEGFVLGSELTNWTEMDVPLTDRTNNLFFRIRSWGDEESGMPDWWQLQYFGSIGVDPYGDPDNDGWNNLEEFKKGTNPNSFDTPPAPQNLTLQVDGTGTNVTLSWQSGGGNVNQYEIDESGSLLGYVSGSQNNYITSLDQLYFGTDNLAPSFSVTALFTNGFSGASATVYLSPQTENYHASLLRNSQGQLQLLTGYLPPGVTSVRLFWATNIYDLDGSDNVYYDIPASNIVNGVYLFTNTAFEPYLAEYATFIEPKYQSGQYGFGVVYNVDSGSWVNASTNLKANLNFLLRSATVSHSFSYESFVLEYPSLYFGRAGTDADYEYSGYRNDEGSGGLTMNAMRPVEENYLWRNFAYVEGDLNTGADYDTSLPARRLDSPPEYEFASGDSPTTPVLTDGMASFYYYLSFADPVSMPSAYTEIGLGVNSSGNVFLPTGIKNLYGLPVLAVKSSASVEMDAGASAIWPYTVFGPSWYVETAAPSLETVDYYFASRPPVPGLAGFSSTNTSQLLITGIGQNITVMGWAKQAILNGYTDKFAYLEQYFDKALQIDTNGTVTTNTTGFLDAYGDFTPTNLGPVALVTMPDIDTGARGTSTVYVVSLVFDRNHGSNMDLSFGGADATSQANPATIWANNNYDRGHTVDGSDFEQDDLGAVDIAKLPAYQQVPDCNYVNASGQPAIPSTRDLEDYFRLWTPGVAVAMAAAPTNYTVQLTLSGDGQIRIFRAYETSGGTNYLFDETTASNQVANSASLYVGLLTSSSPIVLNNRTNEHYIFCGAHAGSAQVDLQILDGNQNVIADAPTYLQINDIKNMYERWTVGDSPGIAPKSAPVLAANDMPVPAQPRFQYTPPQDTTTSYILFVHGWNMEAWEKDRYAEAAYKRLYWQGYHGRFGIFQWPTGNKFAGTWADIATDSRNYDNSEFTAWQSAVGLTNLLTQLNAEYPGNVYLMAHSMGNIVASEALRKAGSQLVNTYVAMQGAVPAHTYDPATTTRAIVAVGGLGGDDGTPNRYAHYYTDGSPSYFSSSAGAGAYVNFYNTNDYALSKWTIDQNFKPDNGIPYPGYHYSSSSGFYRINGSVTTYLNFPGDTYEIFAYGDEARCFALGAEAGVATLTRKLDLQTVWVNDPLESNPNKKFSAHFWHSGEFRGDYPQQENFWKAILGGNGFNLK